jgi:hypothetical protein
MFFKITPTAVENPAFAGRQAFRRLKEKAKVYSENQIFN